MQIDKLEYFLEVARTGSINQAAQNLYISHQALNQSIHLMEKELNVKLLDSNRKGSRLTEQGEIVKETAETILNAWKFMLQILHKENKRENVLRIGCIPYYEWLYYELYAYVKEIYPDIRLEMQTVSCKEALQFLDARELDMAFVAMHKEDQEELLAEHDSLIYDILREDTYGLLVNKQSPLNQKAVLTWEDIKNTPLVFHKQWDSESNQMVRVLKEKGCSNILYVYSENTIYKAVEENLACQIVTGYEQVPESTKEKTKFIQMNNALLVSYGILYRVERQEDEKILTIVKYVNSSCK